MILTNTGAQPHPHIASAVFPLSPFISSSPKVSFPLRLIMLLRAHDTIVQFTTRIPTCIFIRIRDHGLQTQGKPHNLQQEMPY